MNNMFLVFEREYLERVKKKSFLIATILTPLLFPLIIGLAIYLTQVSDDEEKNIEVIDESGLFAETFDFTDMTVTFSNKSLDEAKTAVSAGDVYGVLYIPSLDLDDPKGIQFFSKSNPGLGFLSRFRRPIRDQIEDLKLERLNIEKEVIENLRTSVSISTFNVTESGESKKSDSAVASALGYIMAFMIYMFVFIYGSFIMQSVLNEKTSKIVEVIVSSIKPTQLMLGKVLANAAVALTQFAIWIILVTVFTTALTAVFGYDPQAAQQEMMMEQMEQVAAVDANNEVPEAVKGTLDTIYSLPIGRIVGLFIFYFLGGFLLYGALFAAIGSAVDSIQEAQQFMLPVTLPIILSIILMGAVLANPDSLTSVILTMIPFTSPVLMMARIPFEVPVWQLALSMLLLIGGFIFTLWLAGRIYRVGILTTGSKVTYKTLYKWFTMKNY